MSERKYIFHYSEHNSRETINAKVCIKHKNWSITRGEKRITYQRIKCKYDPRIQNLVRIETKENKI